MPRLKGKTPKGEWIEFDITDIDHSVENDSDNASLVVFNGSLGNFIAVKCSTIQLADDPCKAMLDEIRERVKLTESAFTYDHSGKHPLPLIDKQDVLDLLDEMATKAALYDDPRKAMLDDIEKQVLGVHISGYHLGLYHADFEEELRKNTALKQELANLCAINAKLASALRQAQNALDKIGDPTETYCPTCNEELILGIGSGEFNDATREIEHVLNLYDTPKG